MILEIAINKFTYAKKNMRMTGFIKHVIPMLASRAKAWDLCFLKPS